MIYLSPQGRQLTQAGVRELAEEEALFLIAGRYEGIDERFIEEHVDEECRSAIMSCPAVSCRPWCWSMQ